VKIALVYINSETEIWIGKGVGYIAGVILEEGHDLGFYDTAVISLEATARGVVEGDYDVLMVSCMTLNFPDALALIRRVKGKKNIPILLGGVHATLMGKALLEDFSEIDYACVGEGESFVKDFLRDFGTAKLQETKNLVYRRDGQVLTNPLRPPEDLSKLPRFPWHLFAPQQPVINNKGIVAIHASRGCLFRCTYCSNESYLTLYGKDYMRYRPVSDVIEDIVYIKDTYRPRLFHFFDEMIFNDPKRAHELFCTLKKKLAVPYGFLARPEFITPERIKILRKTGCRFIAMGVECGNESFRKRFLNRHMTNKQIADAFSLAKKAGIFTIAYNMIGFPFDNDDELTRETIAFNQKIKADHAQFTVFYPFPKTALYERCVALGLIDEEKAARINDLQTDSILRGVNLKEKREDIAAFFNKQGFVYRDKRNWRQRLYDRFF
jgi:radical SAM superfamily enzyme YgiQ (UPF0313 family)